MLAIYELYSRREALWKQMLAAVARVRYSKEPDSLGADEKATLERDLEEMIESLEELDVDYVKGIPLVKVAQDAPELRALWEQYHELGEQILDLQDEAEDEPNND